MVLADAPTWVPVVDVTAGNATAAITLTPGQATVVAARLLAARACGATVIQIDVATDERCDGPALRVR